MIAQRLVAVTGFVVCCFAAGCGDGSSAQPLQSSAAGAAGGLVGAAPAAGGGGTLAPSEGCASIEPTYAGFGDGFLAAHCRRCHASSVVGAARRHAPDTVNFDSEADVIRLREFIRNTVLKKRSMPLDEKLDDCQREQVAMYLRAVPDKPCAPDCISRQCGSDSCGGSCGVCGPGLSCNENGACK